MGELVVFGARDDRDGNIFVSLLAAANLMLGANSDYIVECCLFANLSAGERDVCVAILKTGGAVDVLSAKRELPRSSIVAIARLGQEIVGIGAIKRARSKYAAKIATQGDFAFDPHMNELGYVAVAEKHRRRKLSKGIVAFLLSKHKGALFATTSSDAMKSTLQQSGFQEKGRHWEGGNGALLSLWIRDGSSRT